MKRSDIFQSVPLYTSRGGSIVGVIEMPRWIQGREPEVIVWGVRFFARTKLPLGDIRYAEVFGYVVPLGGEPVLPDGSN